MQERVIILIDGSNFYFKLKDLGLNKLLSFDFAKFNQFLSSKSVLVSSRYYIGRIKQDGTKKGEKLFSAQQKLLASLKKSGTKYTLGYLLKNDGVYHEKGVDVQIAVDLLTAAYENQCDKIILVSSDTDLGPAIKAAQTKGKSVEYVGFKHMPSRGMTQFCSSHRLLDKDMLKSLRLQK